MPAGGAARTGSNNLVCGDDNDFISYAGFAAGLANHVDNQYASVSGGAGNWASGYVSSVSGGEDNSANDHYTSVSGGCNNTAVGNCASISGGGGSSSSTGLSTSAAYSWAAGNTATPGTGVAKYVAP